MNIKGVEVSALERLQQTKKIEWSHLRKDRPLWWRGFSDGIYKQQEYNSNRVVEILLYESERNWNRDGTEFFLLQANISFYQEDALIHSILPRDLQVHFFYFPIKKEVDLDALNELNDPAF